MVFYLLCFPCSERVRIGNKELLTIISFEVNFDFACLNLKIGLCCKVNAILTAKMH